jgi:hypothetical protein
MTTWQDWRTEPMQVTPDIWFREVTTRTVDSPYNERCNRCVRTVTKVLVMCDNLHCKDIEVQDGETPDDVAEAHLKWHEDGMPQ